MGTRKSMAEQMAEAIMKADQKAGGGLALIDGKPLNESQPESKTKCESLDSGDSPLLKERLEKLREAYLSVERNQWALGDQLNQFADWYLDAFGKKIANQKIAKLMKLDKSGQHIGNLRLTAKMFPEPYQRIEGIAFENYNRSRRCNNAVQPDKRRISADEIVEAFKAGVIKPRQVRQHVEKKKAVDTGEAMAEAACEQPHTGFLNRIHNRKWEEVALLFKDEKPDIIYADPPFLNHGKAKRLDAKGKCFKADCPTAKEVYETIFCLFDTGRELLDSDNPNAVLLLHQAGGEVDDPKIIKYARDNGWYDHCPIIWVKGREDTKTPPVAMPEQGNAFGCSCQRILVFSQQKDPPMRIGNNNIANVIYMPRSNFMDHPWEHPPELAQAILQNFLHPQSKQIIFEPFACTSPASVCAIRNGWRYVAAESVWDNYRYGAKAINNELLDKEDGVSSCA